LGPQAESRTEYRVRVHTKEGADVQLTRTQTILQGASYCDFRYALKKNEKDTVP
jgi:hypothetical protein